MRSGLSFEANYTFSKVLSDADGDSQSRLQHFLDIGNPGIERSRANFDLTHMIKATVSTICRSARATNCTTAPWTASSAVGSSQHHDLAVRRAVLHPVGARNPQPRIALLLHGADTILAARSSPMWSNSR